MDKPLPKPAAGTPISPDWIEVVKQHVASLRFGVVQVTVHDGRVVQIEKTERLRFDKSQPTPVERPRQTITSNELT